MTRPLAPSEIDGRPISRRDLLRGAVVTGTTLALAACGASPTPPTVPGVRLASSPAASAAASSSPSAAESSPTAASSPEPTLREVIAGLLIVGFRGATLADAPWLGEALATSGLRGVILFDRDAQTGGARNIRSPEQVASLVGEIRTAAGDRHVLVGVDQEGGAIVRLSPAHGFPPVASEATIGRGTPSAAESWARGIARVLAAAGIDLDFAPVVDLDVNPRSAAIGALDRAFSADPEVVVAMAAIEIEAQRAAGVRTTLKHFPGIGSSTTNTDFGVADVTNTWSRTELEPFRRLIAAGLADLVMTGHVVNRDLDRAHPASLSPAVVTGLLRGELGWDGPVITDDLQAAAITAEFGADEAVLLALEAGNDLLLFANQQTYDSAIVDHVVDLVESAVGSSRLAETRLREAWSRVQRLD